MGMRALGTNNGLFPASLSLRPFSLTCLMLTLGLVGCASIHQLAVAPTTVCTGESVNVSWRTCGTTTLTQVPIQPGQSDECVDSLPVGASPVPVSNAGTLKRQAIGDSVFYVEAKSWFGRRQSHRAAAQKPGWLLPHSVGTAGSEVCTSLSRRHGP